VFLTDEETLKKLLDAAVDIILTLVNSILNNLDPLLDAAIGAIEALIMFLLDPEVLGKLAAAALDIILALAAGLISSVGKLVEAATELGESIGEKLKNMDWKQWGEDLMDSLLDGIKAAWESISGWFSDAWSSIKSLFSGADDAVAKTDKAVTEANAKIVEANNKVSSFTDSLKNTAFDVPVNSYQQMGVLGNTTTQPPVNITQNIYTSQMSPAEAMQEARYMQELSLIN
jgi:phage-related protein